MPLHYNKSSPPTYYWEKKEVIWNPTGEAQELTERARELDLPVFNITLKGGVGITKSRYDDYVTRIRSMILAEESRRGDILKQRKQTITDYKTNYTSAPSLTESVNPYPMPSLTNQLG
ncbi:MAG: hypothetical protein LBQ83_01910 [Candidatus Margulisbacteria bacterium]|jgi:hypothetical protein|nr:hypothetical protein [Candidatus Margulisiibacteriota bacterium]